MKIRGTWIQEELGPISIVIGLLLAVTAAMVFIQHCGPIVVTFSIDIGNYIGYALSTAAH